MKKNLPLCITAAVLLLTSCTLVIPSGVTVEHSYYFQNFDSVVVSSSFNATIIRGSNSSINVLADQAASDYLDIHQIGSTLYIETLPNVSLTGNFNLQATIVMPSLYGLTVSGASTASANSFNSVNFVADVSGASTVTLAGMTLNTAILSVSGASTLHTSGGTSVGNANVNVSGASFLQIPVLNAGWGSVSGASTFIYGPFSPNIAGLSTSGASSSRPF